MLKNYIVYIPALLLLAACSSDNRHKETIPAVDSTEVMIDSAVNTMKGSENMVISDIPFPFEILENLHASRVAYDARVMNEVRNVAKYNQYHSKALNLGIYGADLAYVVTYEQFQQIGAYVKNAKKLAEDLHISFAFNEEMMNKYSKFKDNKDSLKKVVYDSYNEVDKSLKGDERVGIAALVVAGSWLEGLYVSTKTFENTPKNADNNSFYKTIAGQRQSLTLVIKLLSEHKNDAYIAALIKDLEEIALVPAGNATDKEMMDSGDFAEKVEKLRNRIIEGL